MCAFICMWGSISLRDSFSVTLMWDFASSLLFHSFSEKKKMSCKNVTCSKFGTGDSKTH